MDSLWSPPCKFCMRPCNELRRCTGCYTVNYCSRECQKADWKTHKSDCKDKRGKTSKRTVPGPSESPKATIAGNTESEQDQLRRSALFGSFTSKKTGTEMTGASGSSATRDNTGSHSDVSKKSDESNSPVCEVCGTYSNLLSCSGCKRVFYCSKACQKRDWKNHKAKCEKIDGVIKTDGALEIEKKKLEEKRQRVNIDYDFNSFENSQRSFLMHQLLYNTRAPRQAGSLTKALGLARRRFQTYYKIVDDLENVPHEHTLFANYIPPLVFVAFISDFQHHALRHGIYVLDNDDHQTHILFYLDNDQPLPYFTWSDVRPGRYICLKDARLHDFLDGTRGIRVDEASYVSFIDV